MKIYTKTGDAGETSLRLSQRVPKDAARVEAYGAVDEANSFIGLAVEQCSRRAKLGGLKQELMAIQRHLFDAGADLSMPPERGESRKPAMTEERIAFLEQAIDAMEAALPPLRRFILPGGSAPAAALHAARTVVRRAERRTVSLARQEALDPVLVKYLNRLSDYLFVAARFANHRLGVPDHEVIFS